jgi:hypothetical protein
VNLVTNTYLNAVSHGGAYPAGGGRPHGGDDEDMRNAAEEASRRAGDSGDTDMFSSILGSITQQKHQIAQGDINEDRKYNYLLPLVQYPLAFQAWSLQVFFRDIE